MKSLTSYISVNNLIRILISKFDSSIILNLRSIDLVVISIKIESIIYERCTPSSQLASWSCGRSLLFFLPWVLLIECAFKCFLDAAKSLSEEAHDTPFFFFFLLLFILVIILFIILVYLLIILIVIVIILIIDITILLLNTNRIRLMLLMVIDQFLLYVH